MLPCLWRIYYIFAVIAFLSWNQFLSQLIRIIVNFRKGRAVHPCFNQLLLGKYCDQIPGPVVKLFWMFVTLWWKGNWCGNLDKGIQSDMWGDAGLKTFMNETSLTRLNHGNPQKSTYCIIAIFFGDDMLLQWSDPISGRESRVGVNAAHFSKKYDLGVDLWLNRYRAIDNE